MIVELSRDELQMLMMLNRAGIDFLQNIDTGKLQGLMDRLESSLPRN